MDPRVGLGYALFSIDHEEGQRVVGIVSVLGQERSAQLALHRNQPKRRVALVVLQPPRPTAAEVAQTVENDYPVWCFH